MSHFYIFETPTSVTLVKPKSGSRFVGLYHDISDRKDIFLDDDLFVSGDGVDKNIIHSIINGTSNKKLLIVYRNPFKKAISGFIQEFESSIYGMFVEDILESDGFAEKMNEIIESSRSNLSKSEPDADELKKEFIEKFRNREIVSYDRSAMSKMYLNTLEYWLGEITKNWIPGDLSSGVSHTDSDLSPYIKIDEMCIEKESLILYDLDDYSRSIEELKKLIISINGYVKYNTIPIRVESLLSQNHFLLDILVRRNDLREKIEKFWMKELPNYQKLISSSKNWNG